MQFFFPGTACSDHELKILPNWLARRRSCCLERDWNPATHDEAEALGILDYVFAKMELPKPWPDGGLFAGAEK